MSPPLIAAEPASSRPLSIPPASTTSAYYARSIEAAGLRPNYAISRMAAPLSAVGVLLDPKEARSVVAYIHHLEQERRIRESVA